MTIKNLLEKLEALEVLIKDLTKSNEKKGNDDLLTVTQAADFLQLKPSTIYSKVHKGEIPFMKLSKRVYFSKSTLTDLLLKSRVISFNESELFTKEYVEKKAS